MTLLCADPSEAPTSWALKFTLGDWDNRAAVRTSTHDYQLPDDVQQQLESRYWFPPDFLPYLSHPAIQAAGRDVLHRLTANHLVHFLDYTTLLEHRIVNRAVEVIVHRELPIHVSQAMKHAALQLYTDEGYHALFSNRLADQIAGFYGIIGRPAMPKRIARMNALIARTSEKNRPLAWFLLGFVSETIIARELLEVCRNSLVSSVNDMLRDHLADEARHQPLLRRSVPLPVAGLEQSPANLRLQIAIGDHRDVLRSRRALAATEPARSRHHRQRRDRHHRQRNGAASHSTARTLRCHRDTGRTEKSRFFCVAHQPATLRQGRIDRWIRGNQW